MGSAYSVSRDFQSQHVVNNIRKATEDFVMEINIPGKLLGIFLILILIIAPSTASLKFPIQGESREKTVMSMGFNGGKSDIFQEYKRSSGTAKNGTSIENNGIKKPDLKLIANNRTVFWDPEFMNQTLHFGRTQSQSSFETYVFRPKVIVGSRCSG